MLSTVVLDTPDLGDRTYLVHDGQVAVVIDPQRDVDRILMTAGRLGVSITHVLETHLHNDYITGGLALAQLTGADYLSHADDPVLHRRTGIRDGTAITAGGMTLQAIATPGHTVHHLSYVIAEADEVVGVFTGGSMLYGTVGRPDLVSPRLTRQLAFAQHASVRRLIASLPASTPVYPTHGFGSWCAVSKTDQVRSTVGHERNQNPAAVLKAADFVETTLSRLDAYPGYFRLMAPLNASTPPLIDLSAPPLVDAGDLRRRIADGDWVVDLRSRAAFADRHLTGSLGFDADGPFTTYLAWLRPRGTPLILLAETAEALARAQRRLQRVGVDRPVAVGLTEDALTDSAATSSYPRVGFAELREESAKRQLTVVDVRGGVEWRDGHIDGALHVPLHELAARTELVPRTEVWVHCGTGARSAIAAGFLHRAGYDVTHIDDSFANVAAAGIEVQPAQSRSGPHRPAAEKPRKGTKSTAAQGAAVRGRMPIAEASPRAGGAP